MLGPFSASADGGSSAARHHSRSHTGINGDLAAKTLAVVDLLNLLSARSTIHLLSAWLWEKDGEEGGKAATSHSNSDFWRPSPDTNQPRYG